MVGLGAVRSEDVLGRSVELWCWLNLRCLAGGLTLENEATRVVT